MPRNYLLFSKVDSISKKVYKQSLKFPQIHQYSIGDQMRRSSLSVVLNIVEGGARKSVKEKLHFKNIAFGSLKETKYLVFFAKEIDLIIKKDFDEILSEINELAAILYTLIYKNKE